VNGSRLAAPEKWPGEPSTVRVIAPDRPGMGTSTFEPARRLTDWADDVRQLADSVGLPRFVLAGFSGGGPHALAVAHGLPDRVIAAGCIQTMA
jgi:pimeloyl-ACP methyl ester carboxylesterase